MRLCIYTLFDKDDRPMVTGIHNSRTKASHIYELYIPKTGKSIYDIEQDEARIKQIIIAAQSAGITIVTSDWKKHIDRFKLLRCRARYNAYDLQLTSPEVNERKRATQYVEAVLERMCTYKIHEWQRVVADAAVVYQDMQEVGLLQEGLLRRPIWHQDTSTGRSKCKGFNIQGIDRKRRDRIRSPVGADSDVLVLFDWISADIRFAGLFAGDEELDKAFGHSDPYLVLASRLGVLEFEDARDDCKTALLRGINSMDTNSPVFSVYPKLGQWIDRCRSKLSDESGYLDTFLGRRFRVRDRENKLQVLNGCMQGSVAHAMQLVIRRIWEELGSKLLAEVHDSLVVACQPDAVDEVISVVADIMLRPFEDLCDRGLVGSSPDFPFKVYVGDTWHGWELRSVHRGDRVEYVTERVDIDAKIQGQERQAPRAGQETSSEASGEVDPLAGGGGESPCRADVNEWFSATDGV